jgi:hypothetical protein
LTQFTRNMQGSAHSSQKTLPQARTVLPSVASSTQLKPYMASKTSVNSFSSIGAAYPKLEVQLGPQFEEKAKKFVLKIEGTDFSFSNIDSSCTLPITGKSLRKMEIETPCTLTVFRMNMDTLDLEPFGIKHTKLRFGREPTQYFLFCGPNLDQEFTLTLKLYS